MGGQASRATEGGAAAGGHRSSRDRQDADHDCVGSAQEGNPEQRTDGHEGPGQCEGQPVGPRCGALGQREALREPPILYCPRAGGDYAEGNQGRPQIRGEAGRRHGLRPQPGDDKSEGHNRNPGTDPGEQRALGGEVDPGIGWPIWHRTLGKSAELSLQRARARQ
jgi:hypothetical protein